ncbi:MAG: ABC transporter ATP-binding protein, partial [Mycetocola sp.]
MTDATTPRQQRGSLLPIASAAQVRMVGAVLLRRHRWRSAGAAVLFLAASALGLVLPASLGRIVDAVAGQLGFAAIALWVGAAAAGAVGAALMTLWAARVLASLVQDCLASLREDVFASAMRLPVTVVDDGETSDLLSRVTGDVDAVAEAGGEVAPTLLSAGFAVVVSIGALAVLDPWLALAGVASVPFYVLGTRAFLRRSRVVFREVRVREAARGQAVLDAVEGADTVTAFNEQDSALGRVHRRAEDSISIQIDGVRLRNRLYRWINGGEAVGLGALLVMGFVLHAQGVITIGMATTAALVFHRLFDPIGQLIFGLDDIQRATIGLARLVGVISAAPAVPDSSAGGGTKRVAATTATTPRGEPGVAAAPAAPAVGMSADDLSFHYATTGRGITGMTLRVEPGTTTALVGTSGSGKSTLARVIAGHHSPSSGRLTVDDPQVTPYYISQELHQFRGGIAENMRLVAPEASDADIMSALDAVGADWARVLMEQSESGSRGVETVDATPAPDLDDGRIQQLAIARALLANPPIVILDEATADVGLQHRPAVDAAITALRRDRTVLVIAHRLHQASTADQILVCADGCITQRGS